MIVYAERAEEERAVVGRVGRRREAILALPEWTLIKIGWEVEPGQIQGSIFYRVALGLGPASADRNSESILRDVVHQEFPWSYQVWAIGVMAWPVVHSAVTPNLTVAEHRIPVSRSLNAFAEASYPRLTPPGPGITSEPHRHPS